MYHVAIYGEEVPWGTNRYMTFSSITLQSISHRFFRFPVDNEEKEEKGN